MARKFLFMRCICIWLGKVARAWIWQQTIIKCGDNKWGYPSKPLHVYWAFKGPSRRKHLTISMKTEFKCRTLKVKHDVWAISLHFYIHSSHQAVRSWPDSRLYGDTLQRHVELTEISPNNLLNFACVPWVVCPVVFLWRTYWPGSHKRTSKGTSYLENSSNVVSVHSTFKLFRNILHIWYGYQTEWFNFILQRNISLQSVNNWTIKSNGIGTKL